jgi:biotin carboxyl carrier protein
VADTEPGPDKADATTGARLIDEQTADRVREVARVAREQGLAELTVCEGDLEITVKLTVDLPASAFVAPGARKAENPDGPSADAPPPVDPSVHVIGAPMPGVFYRAPMPDAPAFVKEGDRVSLGDVVGLIEAMKIFNEIQSPVAGEVVAIVAGNEELLQAGQAVMRIRRA